MQSRSGRAMAGAPLKSISGDFFRAFVVQGEEVRAASRSGGRRRRDAAGRGDGVPWPPGWSNRMARLYSTVNGVTNKKKEN